MLFYSINYVVDFENFIDTEIFRVYSNYEDSSLKGIDYHTLDTALNKIGNAFLLIIIAYNSENVYFALAEVRDIKGPNPLDKHEFEILTRKHKIFEESGYLEEAYSLYRKYNIHDVDIDANIHNLKDEITVNKDHK